MAKPIRRTSRRASAHVPFPLVRQNFIIIGIGLAFIVAGYLALLEGSVEGVLPLVIAPVLLVLGYCVIIPAGILYKSKTGKPKST